MTAIVPTSGQTPDPTSLSGLARGIEPGDIVGFVQEVLLSSKRKHPIVGVTTDRRTGRCHLDPDILAGRLRGFAEVVVLQTGEATWRLADALPARLDVYGGAARIWWPGLKESSEPLDHPLIFLFSPEQAKFRMSGLVAMVRAHGKTPPMDPQAVLEASVITVRGHRVELEAEGERGVLRSADLPLPMLAANLVTGQRLKVRRIWNPRESDPEFSAQGLLPSPWQRVREDLRVGDVVEGRVRNIVPYGCFVELLPGVAGLVHTTELDWDHVGDPREYVRVGQIVAVSVLEIDLEPRRIALSLKAAQWTKQRKAVHLLPGGPPFRWPETSVKASDSSAELEELQIKVQALTEQVEATADDRVKLLERARQLQEQLGQAKRDLRSEDDRYRDLERRLALDFEPTTSERAFLLAVRICYARTFDEGDRGLRPLKRMRVGASFLDTLQKLEGIDATKVVEVCMQVASGVASTIAGREMHQIRGGPAGAGGVVRSSDNARAWRCSLQDNTPAARRLHWWSVPDGNGGTIEFASVGTHDEVVIPT